MFVLAGLTKVHAQFEQGTMLVGGSAGLELITNKEKAGGSTSTFGKSTSFNFSPRVGYFVINNLALGAELGFSMSKFKADGADYETNSSGVTIGPFARYYFGKFYGEGTFGVGSNKDKEDDAGDITEQKSSVTSWSVGAGYAIFLNESVAIEPKIGYGSSTLKYKDVDNYKDIYAGLFFRLGVQVYFRKK